GLRLRRGNVCRRERLEALRSALVAAGAAGRGARGGANSQPVSEMTVFGQRFAVGDKPGVRTEPLKEDVEGMAAVVRDASKQAEYVIVSAHTDEGGGNRFSPPEVFVTFGHAIVDAGADV